MSDKSSGLSGWLRRLGAAEPGASRLVCFPHAGGAASTFGGLATALGSDVEVLAVQYPGRQERHQELPLREIDELAAGAVTALNDLADEPPTTFLGHSMGAVVAFEAALRCANRPQLFVASASRSPYRAGVDQAVTASDEGLIRHLLDLGGTDQELMRDEGFLALVMPALRADYAALSAYRAHAGDRLDMPVVALVGDEDAAVGTSEIGGWSACTGSRFRSAILSGDHFYLQKDPGSVAQLLREEMDLVAPNV